MFFFYVPNKVNEFLEKMNFARFNPFIIINKNEIVK